MGKYIPSTKAEVKDRLGAMVLCVPEYSHDLAEGGTNAVYEDFEHSLDIIRSKIGEEVYEKLKKMGRKSQQLFEEGEMIAGSYLLQDMYELL